MTTEQPEAQRILRRRSEDRVVGGVASGLGLYVNVDPLLVRIAFVGLMVFGGLGLVLYVAAWLVMPDEATDESIAAHLLGRLRLTNQRFLAGLLFLIGGFLFVAGMGGQIAYDMLAVGIGVALMVIVLGGAFLYQGGVAPAGVTGTTSRQRSPAPVVAAAPERRDRSVRKPAARARSPLVWYVFAAILVAIGALATVTNVSGARVDLGQFFGIALSVLGLGLVTGTWWGHARRLVIPGLFILPFAVASSFVTAPIAGGFGEHEFRPANVDELRDAYRLVGGRLSLDLTEMQGAGEPVVIAASVAFGQLKVILPANASIQLDADVGAGELGILGAWQTGTGLADRYVRDADGPRFILDVEMGVGSAWVDGRPVGGDQP